MIATEPGTCRIATEPVINVYPADTPDDQLGHGARHHQAVEQADARGMAKARREGKGFIDWSQNNPAKTIISPCSLRGRDEPTVAAPVTWDEVRGCRRPEQLMFTTENVLDRAADLGYLFTPARQDQARLPGQQTRNR